MQDFQPFKINVLDVASNAILRAFQYLLNEQVRSENTLFLFQEDDYCLAICEKSQQLQILQSHENLTALYEQFTERFEGQLETSFCLSNSLKSYTITRKLAASRNRTPFYCARQRAMEKIYINKK